MADPHRTRWAVTVPLVAIGFLVGIVGLFVVRHGDLDARPWLYVFAGIGLSSAAAALLLSILRTHEVAD